MAIRRMCAVPECTNLRMKKSGGTKGYKSVCKDHYSNSAYKQTLREPACEMCGWNEAPCDVHRIVPGAEGGRYIKSNVVTLCPNCHRLVTMKIKEVPKVLVQEKAFLVDKLHQEQRAAKLLMA